jgi:hypothetical protein
VVISDFVEENFKNINLFHTYNHPKNIVLIELARRIHEKIGLPMEKITLERELLGDISFPPPLSVYFKTKMSFEYTKININGEEYDTQGAMDFFHEKLSKFDNKFHKRWISGIKWGKEKLIL